MSQQKSLDSLMMAYADLSGGSKGSSFKGPPLKEVKREKAAAPEFKPSAKARDWSCLEQSLEDAFVLGPSPSQPEPQPVFGLGTPAWDTAQPQPVQSTAPQTFVDDWGDFQGPAAGGGGGGGGLITQVPSNHINLQSPSSHMKNEVEEEDDFADFVSASFSAPAPSLPSSDPILVKSFVPPQSSSIFSAASIGSPDVFASPLVSNLPPSAASAPLPPMHISPVQQTSSSIPAPILASPTSHNPGSTSLQSGLSNAVGLRLASFQEESPVHNFRKPEVLPQTMFSGPLSNEDDDFDAFTSASSSQPEPAPSAAPIISSATTSFPQAFGMSSTKSILPIQPVATFNDKYADLGDLFSMPVQETSLPTLQPNQGLVGFAFDSPCLSQPPVDILTSGNSLKANQMTKAESVVDEDFGDFIAVQSEAKEEFITSPQVVVPTVRNYVVPSWHETTPPPMPNDDTSVLDKNDLADIVIGSIDHSIDQSAATIFHVDDIDSDFFAPNQTSKNNLNSQETLGVPVAYSSPPDSLSLQSFDAVNPSVQSTNHSPYEDENQSPTSTMEPEQSLPTIPKTEDPVPTITRVKPNFDQLKSPHREWCQALVQIQDLVSAAGDTFSNISDDQVLAEVVESQSGRDHIKNLVEIYRVFKRIQMSYSMAIWNEAVQVQCEETEKAWKRFVLHLKDHSNSIIPIRGVFDFSGCLINNNVSKANVCGICILSLTTSSRETSGVVSETVVVDPTSGYKFHSTCANFWVNCVNVNLPKLV